MLRVSISVLKDQLSAYLKHVRAGETVLVMDRNTPVARIEPISAGMSEDERIARLVAAGTLRRPTQPMNASLVKPVDIGRSVDLLGAVIAERREGR